MPKDGNDRIVDFSLLVKVKNALRWKIATCAIDCQCAGLFSCNVFLDVHFPRQVAADHEAKKRDCVVLLEEEIVSHLQVTLATISFEPRVKNTLCF